MARLLRIPVRTYYQREQLLACTQLAGDAGVLALCLGTRHHDGHLREACLRQLLLQERAWTAPFVVHLCGEYVLEIVEAIEVALPAWNAEALARYLRENPAYVATLERRAVSYWNCYYRWQYPVWKALSGKQGHGGPACLAGAYASIKRILKLRPLMLPKSRPSVLPAFRRLKAASATLRSSAT